MSDKPKWTHSDAMAVAREVANALEGSLERIEIAGSLRRKKPTVSDVEIVYVPRVIEAPNPESLFGEITKVNLADAVIFRLESNGTLGRRTNVNGSEMFGEKNKLMVHRASGIPVDLFSTTEPCWWNYLVCRTGGAETNVAICQAAIRKGWNWEPYGAGFRRIGHTVPMRSEEDVFRFVGLPYLAPERRL